MGDVLATVKVIAWLIVLVFVFLVFGKELRPLIQALVNWILEVVKSV